MKTILILFPVFFSALFAVSAQIRDTAMQDAPIALADRSPSAPLPDGRGALATSQDASVEREVRVSEAGSAVRTPDEPKTKPAEAVLLPASALLDVPFASQAPYENWQLPYKEACEEASVIMVQYYLEGVVPLEETVKDQILAIVDYESGHGYAHDLSIADTGKVAEEFYGVEATAYYDDEVTKQSIQRLIADGHPVIIPALGKNLRNPHYTGTGPPYHMIVLIGYDSEGFISHDPGTKFGAKYRYSYEAIMDSIHDWTGSRDTLEHGGRAMLVLEKKN